MTVFTCDRLGCAGEVVGAGLCRVHLREEALKRKEARPMAEERFEEEKQPDKTQCSVCHRKVGSLGVKRLYGDKCNRCKNASKASPPPRNSEPIEGEGETKSPEFETKEPVVKEEKKEPCHPVKKIPPGERYQPAPEEITVSVDFTRYPNIHQSLLKLAEKEFRTPENQLLFLLHDHLAGLEETAGKQEGAADGR